MADKEMIGDIIKTVREKRGLSQRELAKRAGVTNQTVHSYEKGKIQPSAKSLINLMTAMNYVVIFRPREKLEEEGKL